MTIKFDTLARQEMYKKFNQADFMWDGTPVCKMVVEPIQVREARKYIASFHYSRTMPDSTRFVYAGYLGGKLAGIICYGMGCGKGQYTSLFPNIENGHYIELTRLWCADNMPKNTESKLISESLHMLPPEIEVVLSFSDEGEGHIGTIYQATNWYYVGVNNGGKMLIKDGIKKHPRLIGIYRDRHPELKDWSTEEIRKMLGYEYIESGRKHKYVFLRGPKSTKRKNFNLIKHLIQPYPKANKPVCRNESEIIQSRTFKDDFILMDEYLDNKRNMTEEGAD